MLLLSLRGASGDVATWSNVIPRSYILSFPRRRESILLLFFCLVRAAAASGLLFRTPDLWPYGTRQGKKMDPRFREDDNLGREWLIVA